MDTLPHENPSLSVGEGLGVRERTLGQALLIIYHLSLITSPHRRLIYGSTTIPMKFCRKCITTGATRLPRQT